MRGASLEKCAMCIWTKYMRAVEAIEKAIEREDYPQPPVEQRISLRTGFFDGQDLFSVNEKLIREGQRA